MRTGKSRSCFGSFARLVLKITKYQNRIVSERRRVFAICIIHDESIIHSLEVHSVYYTRLHSVRFEWFLLANPAAQSSECVFETFAAAAAEKHLNCRMRCEKQLCSSPLFVARCTSEPFASTAWQEKTK